MKEPMWSQQGNKSTNCALKAASRSYVGHPKSVFASQGFRYTTLFMRSIVYRKPLASKDVANATPVLQRRSSKNVDSY